MKYFSFSMFRSLRHFWRHQQSGAALVITAAIVPAVIAVAGLSIDVGRAFAAKRVLSGQTQAAAMAGAYALAQANATSSTVTSAVSSWTSAHPASGVTISGSPTPSLSCVTATSNLPSCTSSNPNVVSFTQSGTVPTYFLKAFGVSSLTVGATASAAKAGGTVKPFNIMFVLDATGSMSNADSNCGTIPHVSGTPSRWQCALYSIQNVLKVMPTSLDRVGLMIFPGMGSQYTPSSPCGTQPSSVPYLTSTIKYQIGTTFDSSYNDGSGTLTSTSTMVRAVGDYSVSKTPCLSNKGGEGSYAAEVLTKAQAVLAATNNNATNVIIFLSDGDYNASLAQLNNQSTKTSKQCGQAVTAAQAATTAGTTIYAVAYGAATSGCSSGDTYTPCTGMQAIASTSGKFYSTDATCQISGSTNQVSQLPSVFQAISTSLTSQTKPRLLTQ